MSFNYSTKDLELAGKLQAEGCSVIKISRDPTDGLKKYTFEETINEVNKILGVKPGEKVVEEKSEEPAEVEKKKAGRPKKKGR
jgi:hypothetical protein